MVPSGNLTRLLERPAAAHPDRLAIIDGTRRLTYGQLLDQVRRLAGALRARGLTPGEHVALLLPNTLEFTLAYFATLAAGLRVVPLNVLLSTEEIAYHLADAEAAALIVSELLESHARPALSSAPGCRLVLPAAGLPGLISKAEPILQAAASRSDETAVLLYTSGTTGRSKGAELTHGNLQWNAAYFARHFMQIREPLVTLAALPLFHSFGQTAIQNATLEAGGTLVLLPRFSAESALSAMAEHRVTFFAGVPTMYVELLRATDTGVPPDIRLVRCISGGAPMPVRVMEEFDHRFGVDILEGYGLSETSPVAAQNRTDRPKKAGSIGFPLDGVEFRLIDGEGALVTGPGLRGELEIRGPIVMKGYYRRPEATAEAIREGWFRTGDIAERDAEGYYYIVDRRKDMLLRGGYSVYPREVEEVLYRHPAVAEAAVIGIPDERLGEEVKAVVVLRPGATVSAAELISFCRERVAAYKYPRQVEFVAALPRGPTGKVLKRALRPSA